MTVNNLQNLGRFMYVRVAVANHSYWHEEMKKAEYFQGMPTAFLFRNSRFLAIV